MAATEAKVCDGSADFGFDAVGAAILSHQKLENWRGGGHYLLL